MYVSLCRLRICRNGCSGMPGWGPFEDVYMGSRVNAAHAYRITDRSSLIQTFGISHQNMFLTT